MSTTSFSAVEQSADGCYAVTGAQGSVASTRLRMTDRGRRVLASLIALPLAVGIGAAMLSGGSAAASLDADFTPVAFETVTVVSGDTLWGVAEEVAPTADPRDVMHDIISLNGLTTSAITPGQTLAVPTKYSE